MNTHATNRAPYYSVARWITLVGYTALLLAIGYHTWYFGPSGTGARLALWLLAAAGLLLVLPGLIKGTRRSYQWLCFILLMYFVWYVQALFAGPAPVMAEGETMTMGHVLAASAAGHEIVALLAAILSFCAAMFAARAYRG